MEFLGCIAVFVVIWFFVSPLLMLAIWNRMRELEERFQKLSQLLESSRKSSPVPLPVRDVIRSTQRSPRQVVPESPNANESPKPESPTELEITEFAEQPISRPEELVSPRPTAALSPKLAAETATSAPERRVISAASIPASPPSPTPTEDLQGLPQAARVEPQDSQPTNASTDPIAPESPWSRSSLEEILAGKWLAYVGALAVMIGAGFGLKYAIDNQWLGPAGRIVMGLVSGCLCFAGGAFAMRKEYRFLGQALTGAGLGVLYLSFYAAFNWYDVLSYEWAFAGMVLTTAGGLAFAHAFDSQPTAVLGMIGGFLTPAMLPPSTNSVWELFPYLLLLDIGVLGVSSVRRWTGLQVLVFFGTAFTWLVWYDRLYTPDVLRATLGFLTAFFALFAALSVIHNIVQKRIALAGDFFLILATPIVYFAALYWLTYDIWPYEQGYFALAMTAIYTVFAVSAGRMNPQGKSVTAALAGLAATFLILAPPLSLTGHWVTVTWIVQAVLLVELGLHFELKSLSWTGLSLLAKVQCLLIIYGIGTLIDPIDFQTAFVRQQLHLTVPLEHLTLGWTSLFNNRSYSYLVDMLGLAILAWEFRRRSNVSAPDDRYGPSQRTLELWLASAVPVVGLFLGSLEIFVWGTLHHWPGTTTLSACAIWTSLICAIALAWAIRVGPRGLEQVAWTGFCALIVGLTFDTAWIIQGVTSSAAEREPFDASLWLLNPRGIAFLTALLATAFSARLYLTDERSRRDTSAGTSSPPSLPVISLSALFGGLAFWLGLVMVQLETYVWGQTHQWLVGTQLSASTIWTALFALGLVLWRTSAAHAFVNLASTNVSPEVSAPKGRLLPEEKSEMVGAIFLLLGVLLIINSAVTIISNLAALDVTLAFRRDDWWMVNPRGISFLLACAVCGYSAWRIQTDQRSNQTSTSLWIGCVSFLSGLNAVLIETLVWGTIQGWQPGTILSLSAMWTAAFAAGLVVWRVRLGSQSLDALVQFAFTLLGTFVVSNSTGMLAYAAWLRRSAEISSTEWWLINPRGLAFLMALGAVALGAVLYQRRADATTGPDESSKSSRDLEQLGINFGVVGFLGGLVLILSETAVWGMPHGWLFGTIISSLAMWTAVFAAVIAIWAASSRHRELDDLVLIVFVVLGGFIVLGNIAPFSEKLDGRAVGIVVGDAEWWLINPRGIGFLLAIAAFAAVATLFSYRRTEDGASSGASIAMRQDQAVAYGIAAFLCGLTLPVLETVIWGMPRGWSFGTLMSTSAMWTSIFASGLTVWIASSRNRKLDPLVVIVFVLLGAMVATAGAIPFTGDLSSQAVALSITTPEWWFLNPRGLGDLLAIGATGLAAAIYRRIEMASPEKAVAGQPRLSQILGVSAYVAGFAMVTTEAIAQGTARHWLTGTSLAVTIAWTLYATGTLVAGIYWRAATVRILALSLLVLTIGKVFLIDVWHLETIIRVFAFLSLGVALMLVSFLYRRYRERIRNWVLPTTPSPAIQP